MSSSSSSSPLIIFDFDHTIVELNTDAEVQKLSPHPEVFSEYDKSDWTEFMGNVFKSLHESGVNETSILKFMETLELTCGMDQLIKKCHDDLGAEIIIISDANTIFIDHILRFNKLDSYVSQVYTNVAEFSEEGSLNIRPYHVQNECKLSNRNLCKGQIMQHHINNDQNKKYSFIAYVGDGINDFCPMLRLSKEDLAFPRTGFSLEPYIKKMSQKDLKISAQVNFWNDGTEIFKCIKEKNDQMIE